MENPTFQTGQSDPPDHKKESLFSVQFNQG